MQRSEGIVMTHHDMTSFKNRVNEDINFQILSDNFKIFLSYALYSSESNTCLVSSVQLSIVPSSFAYERPEAIKISQEIRTM